MSTIRGHQGRIELYQNGSKVSTATVTSFSVNQDSSFIKSNYVGNPIPVGDQSFEGWSGQLEMEVENNDHEEMIDSIVTSNLNGIGVDKLFLILTENYPSGLSASYLYMDAQFKMSKSNAGQNSKVTKRLDFQAMNRKKL